ncbi:aspartate aminotransferase family protein [Bradyrhizobium viridifuturi]|jgi:4-aminobutyrate aminotransferase-like enzyme|nr:MULTISPECIES: aspartate aminotransferase family protein [Bradyrhizobium]ERF81442.1 MAG: feruloyl-CoA synthase [Bradyrhizobium sp. DFCI-1]OYU60871.1 MAG: aspartate aminotransferase family protein [Bradyrhizobium sp. PARBB1]PSO28499.1 aspartate aminotransferase family protein [Bradyrhizobium sp. MOS004]QRI72599.1 aspartate aminotransferase family protein [Bradyrhizobium sp. PSBB068]MBR1021096.1 aspartate aminotransferase family protein [Bradyrhizobium viridifuturi]
MAMVNAFTAEDFARLDTEDQALIARRERVLGPAYRLFYEQPLHLVRGEGVWLFDAKGNRYLDAYNNVASMGHCHPKVVEAIVKQTGILNTHTRYLHESIINYAEALTATFPSDLSQVMFTCTGSEANDLAVRIARHATGANGIIATKLAYHGLTSAVAEFSPSLGEFVDLGTHVRTVTAPDSYRMAPEEIGEQFRKDVQAAIDDLKRHGIKPALLIVDTIFSSDGVVGGPKGFLKPAVDAIHAAGGLFIADEVQPGFGRTGDAMWGFMRHGVEPDMVTVGKPMGNGYPMAGVIMRPQVVAEFGEKARYFNTFGGNPVAAAAGMAVLDVIKADNLQNNARDVGAFMQDEFRQLAAEFAVIGDVRGAGLFIGVEIVSDAKSKTPDAATTSRLVNGLRERRILISASGPAANVLKIRPPLVFSRENAGMLVAGMREVLETL